MIGTDEWLEYTIRFQNTGTDTAFNVVLTDTMDVDLDLSSFIPGADTHAFQVSMLPGRVVECRAERILLPDSLTDPGGSQGAISFRIQPHEPVLPGTEFRNNADIFFDVNPPIRTNDAVVVATMSTYIATKPEWNGLYVFPQPATDRLTVVSDRSLGEVVILNVDGRRLWPEKVTGDRVEVDISRLVQGHYLIRVTALDGAFAVRRFIRM